MVTVTPAICVSNAVPLTVYASASNVPSISALPEISKLAATTSPTVIFGVPVNPAALPVQEPEEPYALPETLPVNAPTNPPLAVTIPAAAILPLVYTVAPVLTDNAAPS